MENILDSSTPLSHPESSKLNSSQAIPSSPPSSGSYRKPKKPPPVTPRSFKRFFNPRSALSVITNGENIRTNRHALKDITSPILNRLGPALVRTSKNPENVSIKCLPQDTSHTPSRKRKLSFSSTSSPPQSSPLRRVHIAPSIHIDPEQKATKADDAIVGCNPHGEVLAGCEQSKPIVPLRRSALQSSQPLFIRSLCSGRSRRITLGFSCGTGMTRIHFRFLNVPTAHPF